MKKVLIFAHWDIHGIVDEHVLYALGQYRPCFDTIVFSSPAYKRTSKNLEKLCDHIIIRENIGHDFGSWKDGLRAIDIGNFSEVVFANDSVYGPLWNFNEVISNTDVTKSYLWGMTISEQCNRHLQSYFFSMKSELLLSDSGMRFWNDVGQVCTKRALIERFELRMLKEFESEGFAVRAFFDGRDHPSVSPAEFFSNLIRFSARDIRKYIRHFMGAPYNPTHTQWKQCLESGVPFIKVELLRDNPLRLRTGRALSWIRSNTNYPVELIDRHLQRVRRG